MEKYSFNTILQDFVFRFFFGNQSKTGGWTRVTNEAVTGDLRSGSRKCLIGK